MASALPANLDSSAAIGTLPPLPVHRFTVKEYHRLGEVGLLSEEDRVELLEGLIVPKMNLNPPHSVAVQGANDLIRALLPSGWCIRIQDAISTADSEPEPDLAIVKGTQRDYAAAHPGPDSIALTVEVADSSLQRDRFKCRVYGKAGIPVYWIVNLIDQQVEVYTDPTGPATTPGYRQRDDYGRDGFIPLVIDGATIAEIPAGELLL